MDRIEIRGLHKVIAQHSPLEIAGLTVGAGEIIAVTGPAGSGKEVLFDLLIGKTRPSTGTVRLSGMDPARGNHSSTRKAFSLEIGVLFAEDGLYKNLSPFDNLQLHGQIHGLPAARVLEVLEWVGLADQAGTRLEQLALALRRRIAFGRAVLHSPKILLLFEPFARCDAASIELLSALMTRIAAEGGAIMIFADSAVHLAHLCDSIYVLNQGKLEEPEAPEAAPSAPTPFKIPVKLEDKVILINPADILYVEAEGGRACLRTIEGKIATRFTLSELEERLSRSGFFRAHRAYLVNLQHIREVIPYTRNSFSIRLDDAERTVIPLSKAAAGDLRDLLGY